MRSFLSLTLVAPATAEERLVAELWARGTLGVEIVPRRGEEILVQAYFDGQRGGSVDAAVFWSWGDLGARVTSEEPLLDRDWLSKYRGVAKPFNLGCRLIVDPREPRPGFAVPVGGRLLLRIPARQAFGTGSHESTRLVVEWLEELTLKGQRVLDLGAGTGILSFAALLFGADSVVALECDPVAAFLARQNQDLNQIRFPVLAGRISCLACRPLFDLVLVNVLPEAIETDLADLVGVLRPGGRGIFSGLLADQEEGFRSMMEEHGLLVLDRREGGEWVALMLERRPS
jgi:ribosomal protein L11 methyltransferase